MDERRKTVGFGGGGTIPAIPALRLLLLLHFVGFMAVLVLPEPASFALLDRFGLSTPAALAKRPWQLATHVFLDRQPLEFVLAVSALIAVGADIERRLGSARLVVLYVGSGALTGVLHLMLPPSVVPVLGKSFSGGLGATGALLTANLILWNDRRALGIVPAPGLYALAALGLFGAAWFVDIGSQDVIAKRLGELATAALVGAEAKRPAEEIADAYCAGAAGVVGHRPEVFVHLMGLAVGGVVVAADLIVARLRERARTRREIRDLEEEVVARARVEQLLEKISREGIASLSARERKFLKYASRFYRDDLLTSS